VSVRRLMNSSTQPQIPFFFVLVTKRPTFPFFSALGCCYRQINKEDPVIH
jgi:hypothetical protein